MQSVATLRRHDQRREVINRLLTALGAWSPLVVFGLAAGESAAFLGLFLPGEVTVILGGVLAGAGVVPLWVMLVASVLGAVAGDSVGFWLGSRFGPSMLRRPGLARFSDRLEAAQASLARRGWWALVVARFTSFLRAVVPFAAGMASMPYRRFIVGNVIGGVLWASMLTLVGFVAGDRWTAVEHWLARGGLILAGVVVALGVIVWAGRWAAGHRERVVGWLDPLARTRVARFIIGRLEGPVRKAAPLLYLWPAAVVIFGGLWVFAGLLQDVLGQEEFFFFDSRALEYAATHQIAAVTSMARWLGTTTPVWATMLLSGGIAVALAVRRYPMRALGVVFAAGGQWVIVEATQYAVARTPPSFAPLAAPGGYGFPSEYIASLAALLVIAAWPWRSRQWRRAVAGFSIAALLLTVAASARVALLLSYPSDVLGGIAVGAGWTVFVLVLFDPRPRTALGDLALDPPPVPQDR